MNYDKALYDSYHLALASPDPSTQNGAVLLNTNGICIGAGWNDFPRGVSEQYWHGSKDDKYARVIHAEVAAILSAAKNGYSTMGSTLVCPWAACSNCAKHIAGAGVSRLVRHSFANSGVDTGSHWYADCAIGDEIFQASRIEIIEVAPVPTDVQLRRNGALWPESVALV